MWIHCITILLCLCVTSHASILSITRGFFLKEMLMEGDDCIDELNQQKGHGDVWNATVGSCAKVACFHGTLKKFKIDIPCRKIEDIELPDPVNCQRVQDMTLHYPDCCEVIQCSVGVYPTTPPASVCRDIPTESACQKWDYVGGCDVNGAVNNQFNVTTLCPKTCGICT